MLGFEKWPLTLHYFGFYHIKAISISYFFLIIICTVVLPLGNMVWWSSREKGIQMYGSCEQIVCPQFIKSITITFFWEPMVCSVVFTIQKDAFIFKVKHQESLLLFFLKHRNIHKTKNSYFAQKHLWKHCLTIQCLFLLFFSDLRIK